jgi:hypothetical protein
MPNRRFFERPFSLSLIIGLVCICIAIFVLFSANNILPAASILSIVLQVVLITGLLLIVLGLGLRHILEETTKNLRRRIQLSDLAKECDNIGLAEIDPDSSNYHYDDILSDSRQLVIVLNDGRTWASVNRDRLRRRFADSSKQTTFILCHPDSPMVPVLARKGSKDEEDIRKRIMDTVALLEDIKQPSTSLEILGHFLFNPYSLILGDDSAITIPYFISRGGRTTPVFKYKEDKDNNYFTYLVKDIERLRMDTKDISSASKNKLSEGVLQMRPR